MTSQEEEQPLQQPLIKNQKLEKIVTKLWELMVEWKFIILIGVLAFWFKIVYVHSTDMWDEGWFTAIAVRIADGLSDPFLPLYYEGSPYQTPGKIEFFDKPPFAFIAGAFLMNIFGRTTFAAKGIVIIGGAGLAVLMYLLFSHQEENRIAHIITGLLVALAYFLTSYSRTAYIDPFVIFMGALVLVMGIRAIDAIFVENKLKKGYILIVITGILNVLNIMTKAWQGILIAPSIGVYLVFRYLERHIDFSQLTKVWHEIIESFSTIARESKDNSENNNFYHLFAYYVLLVAFIIAFPVSFLYNQLLIADLMLALVVAITCYSVYLRFWKKEILQPKPIILLLTGIASFFSGIAGSIIVSMFYNRLAESFQSFAVALESNDVFTGIFGGFLALISKDALGNASITLLLLQVLAALLGVIIATFVVLILFGLLLDLISSDRAFVTFVYEFTDIIPLIILAMLLLFWFVGILLEGLFFDREALSITLFGIGLILVFFPLLFFYPRLKNNIIERFKVKARYRTQEELARFSSHLIFLGIALIIVIISFYPFVAWVQFIDTNIANGTFPWSIRVPGEMSGDHPDPLTYTFLFFEYYIGWRYTHGNAYDLPGSFGSAINDYVLIVLLPFFLIGLWAFFFSQRRNPALGSALVAWLLVIPFIFFPAKSQLNYYYIPCILPYFGIAAKGIEFTYCYEKLRLIAIDNTEKLLAGAYFYLEISLIFIIFPTQQFLEGITTLDTLMKHVFVSGFYLIPFTFLCFRVLKTFPGIITVGFAYKYFIDAWFYRTEGLFRLYNVLFHELPETVFSLNFSWIINVIEFGAPLATLIGLILLIFALYWLKPHVKKQPQVLIILGLILSGMMIHVSMLAHNNQIFDMRYQEMAIYVNNHGGDYNYSTWVIPEAGTGFALRYYLGYEVLKTDNYPFTSNSTSSMDSFSQSRPYIKFWVIINNSKHWNVPAYAVNYSAAYLWFTSHSHLACVDDIVGLTSWYKMHLFVNRTWISEQGYNWSTLTGK